MRWEGIARSAIALCGGTVIEASGVSDYQGWGSILFVLEKYSALGVFRAVTELGSKLPPELQELIQAGPEGCQVAWDVIQEKFGKIWGTLSWSYGSCSGCDAYEDLNADDRLKAFIKLTSFFDEVEARRQFEDRKGW
jgi:hypothetical protein